MPSWDDGENSSSSLLGEFVDMDYAPDTTDDPNFHGLAVGCPELCRVHKLEPQKCVAFEGTNTGRRFYMCSVGNQVMNCGFVSWLDGEWPRTLQNCLSKLWGMYLEKNSAWIDDRVQNARVLKELADEKKKVEEKYSTLLADVDRFIGENVKRVDQQNYEIIMSGIKEDLEETKKENIESKKKVEVLSTELSELKQVRRTQADIMKAKQQESDVEKEALKEEKRKLEYMLWDMVKASAGNKEKLKRIKAICDE